jgi:Flp pilus assembly protein TadB
MSGNHQPPSWERIIAWLVAVAVSLQILADVLPRLLVPLLVLAVVAGVLRLIWWYTQL